MAKANLKFPLNFCSLILYRRLKVQKFLVKSVSSTVDYKKALVSMCLSRSSQLYLLCTCQTCTFGGLLKDCRQKGLLSFCEAFVGKTITEEKGRFDKDVCMAYSNSSLSKLRSNLTNFSGHEQCQHCLNFYNENPTPQVHLHLHSTMPSKYF